MVNGEIVLAESLLGGWAGLRVGQQGHHAWGLAAAWTEVPLVDGQPHIETQVKLVFRKEGWDVAHYCFVEAAGSHKSGESGM